MDNHACISPLSFLQAGCPSCCPTNNVKALKAQTYGYLCYRSFNEHKWIFHLVTLLSTAVYLRFVTLPKYGSRLLGWTCLCLSVGVCICVCLSVCMHISGFKNHTSKLPPYFLCTLHVTATRSFCDAFAVCYAVPVLWMTSYLPIMAGNMRCETANDQSDSPGGSTAPGAESDVYSCLVDSALWMMYLIVLHKSMFTHSASITQNCWHFSTFVGVIIIRSLLWHCWLGDRRSTQPVKKLSDKVLVWLSVWSKV